MAGTPTEKILSETAPGVDGFSKGNAVVDTRSARTETECRGFSRLGSEQS